MDFSSEGVNNDHLQLFSVMVCEDLPYIFRAATQVSSVGCGTTLYIRCIEGKHHSVNPSSLVTITLESGPMD